MKKIEELQFQNEDLKKTVIMLLNEGMKVYVWSKNENKTSWAYFVENNDLGYVQADTFSAVRFSTCHKAKKGYTGTPLGGGYSLQNPHKGVQNPTIEHARQAFRIAPHWAKLTEVQNITKYTSMKEYTDKGHTLEHVEVTL